MKLMAVLEKYNIVEKTDKTSTKEDNEKTLKKNEENKIEDTNEYIEVMEAFNEGKEVERVEESKYTRQLGVDEIYQLYKIKKSEGVETVFLLEKLIKALPENLPTDVLKSTMANIIVASNIDLENLLGDGKQRVDALNELIKDCYIQTNEKIEEYKVEIERLNEVIRKTEEEISLKQNILQEQTGIVKAETKRIENILRFFKE